MKTVELKTNLLLWLLSGRSSGFVEPALNTGVNFSAVNVPVDIAKVRELLKLNDERTDMFALGALASLYASIPALRMLPTEQSTAFLPHVTSSPIATCDVPLYPGEDAPLVTLLNVASSSTVPVVFTLVYEGGKTRVTTDVGVTALLDHTLSGGRLYVHGSSAFGIRASFGVSSWTTGSSITLTIPPTRYPYAFMAAAISDDSAALRLMAETGTIEAFSNTSDAVRKVGALASAIAIAMYKLTAVNGVELVTYEPSGPVSSGPSYEAYQLLVNWAPILFESSPITYPIA